mgnify:CR=1 FL=1
MSHPQSQKILRVEEGEGGLRMDVYLTRHLPEVSRSKVQAAIKSGLVFKNGVVVRAAETVSVGDEISWQLLSRAAVPAAAQPEDMPLDILFEDASLLILNKPAGIVVHPGAGHHSGTLVAGLLNHCLSLSTLGGEERPGIVHRLDKETSGCLVVAKTDQSHAGLSALFERRDIRKTYLALVAGRPRKPSGRIEIPIARHRIHRQKMAADESGRGRTATTEYRMVTTSGRVSLIECHPLTGRTHQIRVHLKHLNCPVLGDPVYGRRESFSRQMLHAWKLEFLHPVTGTPVSACAPIPREFFEAFPQMPSKI